MKNFVMDGGTVTVLAPSGGLFSGQGVVIGALFGVAAYDAIEAAEAEIKTTGVFTLPKSAGAITEGAIVFWDDTGKVIENASGLGFYPIGVAVAAALDADPTVNVRLDGVAVVAAGA